MEQIKLWARCIVFTAALAFAGHTAFGQNNNYIRVRSPRVAISSNTVLDSYTNIKDSVSVAYQYMDGLGRPLQTVQQQGSATGKDVVQPFYYDELGREAIKYMPYTTGTGTTGSYRANALIDSGSYAKSAQYKFYQKASQGYVTTPYPFAGTNFDNSSANRPIEQGAPGQAWQLSTSGASGSGHTQRMDYASNDQSTFSTSTLTNNPGSRKVLLYTVAINSNQSRTLSQSGSYANGTLVLSIVKDENWATGDGCLGTTEEYKDLEGHVLVKRTYNKKGSALEMLSTYYVYDDMNQLAFVLPPGASPDAGGTISQATLNNLCYQYRYDERGRLSQKKLPGRGWDYVVYNIISQPVAMQDSMQRSGNKWVYTKYDALGRAIGTGLWTNNNTAIGQQSLQSSLNTQTVIWETAGTGGYSNNAWPTTYTTALTANYYDNYANMPAPPVAFTAPSGATQLTRGLLTASQTAVLNTPADKLWKASYYDDLGRNIKAYAQHYLGGTINAGNYDALGSLYDFTNQITRTIRQHYKTGSLAVTVVDNLTYDHTGRKLKTKEYINGNGQLLNHLVYNELGQLYIKGLHGNGEGGFNFPSDIMLNTIVPGIRDTVATHRVSMLQGFKATASSTSRFRASIGGYLQTITYAYNERGWLRTGVSSGNLFNIDLRYNTPDAGVNQQFNGNIAQMLYQGQKSGSKTFKYTYDDLDRLTNAQATGDTLNEALSYDAMGNIKTLTRGGQAYSTLTYAYLNSNQSNQLSAVTGTNFASRSYAYDGNGNVTSDGYTKSIGYNILNLPQTIKQSSSTIANYTYDATGQKLRNVSVADSTWDYVNGIVYRNNAIAFIQNEEGRAVPNGSNYKYQYNLKDHLGNVRVSFERNPATNTASVIQEDEYYSFGLRKAVYNNTSNNRYLYNDKELQADLANQYDYGARFYDPVIGRFTVIDAFAEKSLSSNVYQYGLNNPIKNIDMNGDSIKTFGSATATAMMKQILEGVVGENGTVSQNSSGTWSITQTDDQILNMTADQADEINTISSMMSDKRTAKFDIVDYNDGQSQLIMFGDNGVAEDRNGNKAGGRTDKKQYSQYAGIHTIDVEDIKNLGTTGLMKSKGMLAHELVEGFQIQANGVKSNPAHDYGIATENSFNGSKRLQRGAQFDEFSGNAVFYVAIDNHVQTVTISTFNMNFKPKDVKNNVHP